MKSKKVIIDEEVLAFALQRCKADHDLGVAGARLAPTLRAGRLFADYVVMNERLRRALESASDE